MVLAMVLTLTVSAEAQKKKPVTKKTTTTTAAATNTLEVKQAAEKVSIQIKNVTKFIYVLGGIAQGIEATDKEAKTGKLTKAIIDKNNNYKQTVVSGIRNLKAGLAELETLFRSKPSLKTYVLSIEGITELCNQSEDLAIGGQFSESGRPLLTVVEKLADTLTALP
ncbi:MAG: hypothetical protein JSS81_22495 [Acidobacteria bacterium]|nr:hypothetical protein [Acidobacteriota bacterium]